MRIIDSWDFYMFSHENAQFVGDSPKISQLGWMTPGSFGKLGPALSPGRSPATSTPQCQLGRSRTIEL